MNKFTSSCVRNQRLKESSGLKLISFSMTRWAFTFVVLKRLLQCKDDIDMILKLDKDDAKLVLNEWQYSTIDSFCKLIEPFWNAITDLEVCCLIAFFQINNRATIRLLDGLWQR